MTSAAIDYLEAHPVGGAAWNYRFLRLYGRSQEEAVRLVESSYPRRTGFLEWLERRAEEIEVEEGWRGGPATSTKEVLHD